MKQQFATNAGRLHWRVLAAGVLVAALSVGVVGVQRADGQLTQPPRLAGADRYGTAVAVSQHRFPDGAQQAYVARADVNPDALVASFSDGPTLLVPQCGPVPQVVMDELARLGAEDVIVVGGEVAISQEVGRQIATRIVDAEAECRTGEEPSLEVTRKEDTPEGFEVDVTLFNGTEQVVVLFAGFSIERQRSDGGWEAVLINGDHDVNFEEVPPDESSRPVTISPYPDEDGQGYLEPGSYRANVRVEPKGEFDGMYRVFTETFEIP